MKIPTGHMRLFTDRNTPTLFPRLQQWLAEVHYEKDSMGVFRPFHDAPHHPDALGEWIDVPMVYGESDEN